MRSVVRFSCGFLIGAVLCLTPEIRADMVYDYSFSSDGVGYFGATNVAGTVSGQVTLPDGDGIFQPILVTVDSHPVVTGVPNLNLIPTSWQTLGGPGFTVSGGVITDAGWTASEGAGVGYDSFWFNTSGLNFFSLDTGFAPGPWTHVSNNGGFSGITFSAQTVPEPMSAMLMAIGLGTVALVYRRRRPEAAFFASGKIGG